MVITVQLVGAKLREALIVCRCRAGGQTAGVCGVCSHYLHFSSNLPPLTHTMARFLNAFGAWRQLCSRREPTNISAWTERTLTVTPFTLCPASRQQASAGNEAQCVLVNREGQPRSTGEHRQEAESFRRLENTRAPWQALAQGSARPSLLRDVPGVCFGVRERSECVRDETGGDKQRFCSVPRGQSWADRCPGDQ